MVDLGKVKHSKKYPLANNPWLEHLPSLIPKLSLKKTLLIPALGHVTAAQLLLWKLKGCATRWLGI